MQHVLGRLGCPVVACDHGDAEQFYTVSPLYEHRQGGGVVIEDGTVGVKDDAMGRRHYVGCRWLIRQCQRDQLGHRRTADGQGNVLRTVQLIGHRRPDCPTGKIDRRDLSPAGLIDRE